MEEGVGKGVGRGVGGRVSFGIGIGKSQAGGGDYKAIIRCSDCVTGINYQKLRRQRAIVFVTRGIHQSPKGTPCQVLGVCNPTQQLGPHSSLPSSRYLSRVGRKMCTPCGRSPAIRKSVGISLSRNGVAKQDLFFNISTTFHIADIEK